MQKLGLGHRSDRVRFALDDGMLRPRAATHLFSAGARDRAG